MPGGVDSRSLGHPPADEDDEDEGLSLERVRELLGFAWRARRRHPALAATLFLTVSTLSIAAALVMPRTFTADVKILAQRNLVLPALGNPNRSVPREADNPTKNVADTILKREQLVSLVKDLNLIDWWSTSRPRVALLKDKAMFAVFGRPSDDDTMRTIVEVLEKRLLIQNDESTITISVDWSDPKMAFDIVSLVEKNFLNAGYDADVAMINDAIQILNEHAREEQANVDTALAEIERLRGDAPSAPAPAPAAAPAPSDSAAPSAPAAPSTRSTGVAAPSRAAPPAARPVDPTLVKALADQRQVIKRLEDERAQRVGQLNQQLADALVTLASAHPTVIALKQKIQAASEDGPELAAARAEARAIEQTIADDERAAAAERASAPVAAAPSPTSVAAAAHPSPPAERPRPVNATNPQTPPPPESSALVEARDHLRVAQLKSQEMLRRLDAARIELDVARAAFKYRFSEVRPPEVPKKARKPNVPLVIVGGVLGAFVLALLGAAARDRATGRFIESWQVKRKLKLPVLGELRFPPSAR